MTLEKQILDPDLGMGFRSLRESSVDELIHSGGVAIRTGEVCYVACAGYVSFDEGDTVQFAGDLEGQTRQVFRNLEKCLAEAGLGLQHIVRLKAHVVPPFGPNEMDVVNSVVWDVFRKLELPPPATTLIVVHNLAVAGLLIEIDCDAVAPRELANETARPESSRN